MVIPITVSVASNTGLFVPSKSRGSPVAKNTRIYIVITPLSVFSQVTPWKRRLLKKPSLRQWYKCVKNYRYRVFTVVTQYKYSVDYRFGRIGLHIWRPHFTILLPHFAILFLQFLRSFCYFYQPKLFFLSFSDNASNDTVHDLGGTGY